MGEVMASFADRALPNFRLPRAWPWGPARTRRPAKPHHPAAGTVSVCAALLIFATTDAGLAVEELSDECEVLHTQLQQTFWRRTTAEVVLEDVFPLNGQTLRLSRPQLICSGDEIASLSRAKIVTPDSVGLDAVRRNIDRLEFQPISLANGLQFFERTNFSYDDVIWNSVQLGYVCLPSQALFAPASVAPLGQCRNGETLAMATGHSRLRDNASRVECHIQLTAITSSQLMVAVYPIYGSECPYRMNDEVRAYLSRGLQLILHFGADGKKLEDNRE